MSGPAGKRHEVDLAIRRLASDDADRVASSMQKLTVHSANDTHGGGTAILQQGGIPLIVRAMKQHSKKKDLVQPAVMILANLSHSSQRFPEDAAKEMIEHNVILCTISAIKTFSDDPDFLFPAFDLLAKLVKNESAVFDQIRELKGFQQVLSTMRRFPASSNIQSTACQVLSAGWGWDSQKNPENVLQARAGFLGRIGAIPVVLQTLETFQESAEVTQPAFETLNFLGWNRECQHEIVDKGASLIVKTLQMQATTTTSTKKSPGKRPNHPPPLQEGCSLLRTLANDGIGESIYSPVPHLKERTQGILCEKGAVTVLLEDVMKKHPNDSRLNEEAAAALFNLCSGQTAAVTAYESGIIQVLVATMTKHKRHAGCLEKCLGIVWNLCGFESKNVQSNAVGDAIKVAVVETGLLDLMAQAIRAFATSSETLCYEGVGAIFHLCNTRNERVRSAICGERLRNTIQQVLAERQRAGRTVPCLDETAEAVYITELVLNPRIKTAMRRDPVVGVILYAYERYQNRNETIARHGRFIQEHCIQWQHACLDRQKYEQCTVCHTTLGFRGGGFSCNRCKAAHYCGPECQKKHWPTHKLECKPVVDDANSGTTAKSSARSSNNKKKSSKKSSKKKKK